MFVTLSEYAPEKIDLCEYHLEDGRVVMRVLDAHARKACVEIMKSPIFHKKKRVTVDQDPEAWLRGMPAAYSGSRLRAHLTLEKDDAKA